MTPEPVLSSEPDGSPGRPFPWRCPRCGRKEVNRTVISSECQRLHQGRPVTVAITDFSVPKCAHCGELVFDYTAEQQIDRAFHVQTSALNIADGSTEKDGTQTADKGHSSRVKE